MRIAEQPDAEKGGQHHLQTLLHELPRPRQQESLHDYAKSLKRFENAELSSAP